MKYPKLSFLSICFCFNISFGQELPKITPPSPSAFELTKYGDVQINESRGKLTHTVPIHTYTSGSLQFPISFSYAGDGVKVDQLSSWTGINWVLNAGGVITRTVKDRPDELGNRFLYSFNELKTMTETINGIQTINLLESGTTYDTEADHFSFSFASYSGSFYLDKALQPKLATYDTELKIEFLGGVQNNTSQVIIITDPNGIKYYFGGTGGTEQTRVDFTNSSSGLLPTTAFYLYKIINPVGDEINLYYDTELDPYNIKLSKSQSVTATLDLFNTQYSTFDGIVYNKIYNGKYLSKITSNRSNLEVNFNSTAVANQNYNRILNEINIVKSSASGSENFKKFTLSYVSKNSLQNSTRFFLDKINFLNSQNVKEYDYHFEYNSYADLPDRLSNSKDYFGYFNGKLNDTDLPINNDLYLKSVPGLLALADREPNFSKAALGALTKIHYPTGGYTSIEYEAPKIKKNKLQTTDLDVYCNLSQMNPSAYPIPDTQLIKKVFIDEETSNMPLPSEDQQVVFNIDAVAQGNINHHYTVYIKVENLWNPLPAQIQSFNLEYGVYSYTKTLTFNFLKNNAYLVTVELGLPPSTSNPAPVDVNVSFKYTSGVDVIDGIGVRVKKITDNPIVGNSTTKRYYYQKISDINDINKIPYATDLSNAFISSHQSYYIYPLGGTGYLVDRPTTVSILKSDPIYSNYFSNGPFYKDITISYGGDSFENGGIQKEFRYFGQTTGINFLSAIDKGNLNDSNITNTQTENRDIFDGRLLKERIFKLVNGTLFMVKENENEYSHDISQDETNMAIKRLYHRAAFESTNILDGLHIGIYKTHTNKFNITSKTTKDYLNLVPISDLENANNYKHIFSKQQFEYKNYVGLASKTITNTSNDNKVIENIKFYPDDVSLNTDLGYDILTTAELDAIKKLQKPSTNNPTALHQIETPIQVETITKDLNNTLLSNTIQRTNFFEPYTGIVLPKDVQTLKGVYNSDTNTLEDRIIFHGYYPNGNTKEVSKKDGTKTVYIWGYNQTQPIAKIENSTSGQVAPYITNIQTISNGTDEQALIIALNELRTNLPNAMVTTYTYIPQIGISTITDSKGDKITYVYDSFNRLQFIKDKNGNIISESQYQYKQ